MDGVPVPFGLHLTAEWLRGVADDIDSGKYKLDDLEKMFEGWLERQPGRRSLPEYGEATSG